MIEYLKTYEEIQLWYTSSDPVLKLQSPGIISTLYTEDFPRLLFHFIKKKSSTVIKVLNLV